MSAAATVRETLDINRLDAVIRRHLGVPAEGQIEIEEISRHTNLNYVFRVMLGNRSIYLKVVPERPKKLPMRLPRRRVFAEAEAVSVFRRTAGDAVAVPEVLFVDADEFVLGMTDVGDGRDVLLDVIATEYELFVAQASALGRALGRVHSATRGMQSFRPADEDRLLRVVVFQGLLGPGAGAVFPDLANDVLCEMARRTDCLVHADLWGKNILIGRNVNPAVVDFEGAFVGDPAFDISTLFAVSLLPAVENPGMLRDAKVFANLFLSSYRHTYGGDGAVDEISARAFYYLGTMLAARGFGPFAYPMSAESRERLRRLAGDLTLYPPGSIAEYCERIDCIE